MSRFIRWRDARRSRVWLDDYDGGHWHHPQRPATDPGGELAVPFPREEPAGSPSASRQGAVVG